MPLSYMFDYQFLITIYLKILYSFSVRKRTLMFRNDQHKAREYIFNKRIYFIDFMPYLSYSYIRIVIQFYYNSENSRLLCRRIEKY